MNGQEPSGVAEGVIASGDKPDRLEEGKMKEGRI